MKKVLQNSAACEKLVSGVKKIASAVKCTLGPRGKNVVLDRKFATPLVTNDGVTIAREFELDDIFENIGAKLVRESSQKTNDVAGDGTTSAIVLAEKIFVEGVSACAKGVSPILVNKGIVHAKNLVVQALMAQKNDVQTQKQIAQVATISSQDEAIGELIAKAHHLLKDGGDIALQDSKSTKTELVFEEGLSVKSGLLSPYLATNAQKGLAEFDECFVLLADKKICAFAEVLPILEQIVAANKPLVIFCDEICDEALSAIVVNKVRGAFSCCVVKNPFYADKKLAVLHDIASLTGAKVFSSARGDDLKNAKLDDLGKLKHAKISKDCTTMVASNPNKDALEERKALIQKQIDECTVDFDKNELQKRLSALCGGVATIFVGANTEVEQREKKLRIEDAIASTKSAMQQGIVAGGGVALLRCAQKIKPNKKMQKEFQIGMNIVKNAICEPAKQILLNADFDADEIVEKIARNKNKNFGFDALNAKFCDMMKSGIVDPTKVTISAIENAVSIATTMLTTCVLVAEE